MDLQTSPRDLIVELVRIILVLLIPTKLLTEILNPFAFRLGNTIIQNNNPSVKSPMILLSVKY